MSADHVPHCDNRGCPQILLNALWRGGAGGGGRQNRALLKTIALGWTILRTEMISTFPLFLSPFHASSSALHLEDTLRCGGWISHSHESILIGRFCFFETAQRVVALICH